MSARDKKATKAFLRSGGYDFCGKELKPFSPQRQAVASEMGMTWPWFKPDDRVEIVLQIDGKPATIGHYRQSYKDSVIALWLCDQVESRVDRAERKPEEAMAEAWEWAKKIGMNQNTEKAGEALAIWIQITNELGESKGEPVIGKTDNDNESPPQEGEV